MGADVTIAGKQGTSLQVAVKESQLDILELLTGGN
jgi:hypothetical protein